MLTITLRIINQLVLGYVSKLKFIKKAGPNPSISYDVPFRCWPVDLDVFVHMNNASFIRVAELSRWRSFYQSDTLGFARKNGLLFLVVEQQVSYLRQLNPFTKYIVNTSLTTQDNKWLFYKHTFLQDPSTVKAGAQPTVYAVINVKAVMKERTGKTVRLDELAKTSNFYKDLLPTPNHPTEPTK